MTAWYLIFSLFITNGLRILLGVCLVAALLGQSGPADGKAPPVGDGTVSWPAIVLSIGGAVLVTALACFSLGQFWLTAVEIAVLLLPVYNLSGGRPRMGLFIAFYYEITIALWEFIISAGLGILFCSESFLAAGTPAHMAAVWMVRLLMLAVAAWIWKTGRKPEESGGTWIRKMGREPEGRGDTDTSDPAGLGPGEKPRRGCPGWCTALRLPGCLA